METNHEKVDKLTQRIENLNYEIDELLQIKVNLMMLRHKFNMRDVGEKLEECFTDEMKKHLKQKYDDGEIDEIN